MVTTLALAELTEGITPLVHATVFAMAYYGPNNTIIGSVMHVEDVGSVFQSMLLLFGIDILSIIVNSQILSKLTDVKLYPELCRIMKGYWKLMAVIFALNSCAYFATTDINLGLDSTGEWAWINQEGRLQLINNSIYLSDEEKAILLSQQF